MRSALFVVFLAVSSCSAQYARDTHAIEVSGDAEVRVVPDEVTVFFGVEDRNKDISAAITQNNSSVKQLISAIRSAGVEPGDIQTDTGKAASGQPLFHVRFKAAISLTGAPLEYHPPADWAE